MKCLETLYLTDVDVSLINKAKIPPLLHLYVDGELLKNENEKKMVTDFVDSPIQKVMEQIWRKSCRGDFKTNWAIIKN